MKIYIVENHFDTAVAFGAGVGRRLAPLHDAALERIVTSASISLDLRLAPSVVACARPALGRNCRGGTRPASSSAGAVKNGGEFFVLLNGFHALANSSRWSGMEIRNFTDFWAGEPD
jgi:hypothetical protein